MASFGDIFSLRAVIDVVTGNAFKEMDALDKAGRQLGKSFDTLETSGSKAGSALTSSFKSAAGSILAFVGLQSGIQAISNAISGAVGSAITFEKGVRNLNTILKLSDAQLADYAEEIRTLGQEMGINVTSTQAVAAAYDVAQAGFTKAADNALVMQAALKAASASGADASTTANLISSTLRAYGLEANQAGRVSDVLFKTVENGIITIDQFQQGFGGVTAVAAQAGVSLEEIGAAVATATNQGIRASSAFDGIRGALANLIAPSQQSKGEMAKYGLVINENTLRQKGLLATLQEITTATGGSAQAMRTILGDVQAFSVALSISSKDGKIATENLRDMEDALGATDASLKEQSKTFSFAFDQMKAAAESAGIAVAGSFGGAATDAIKSVTDVIISLDRYVTSLSRQDGGLLGGLVRGFQNTFPATYTMLQQLGKTLGELAKMVMEWFGAFGGSEADAAATVVDFFLASIIKIADVLANVIGIIGKFFGLVVKGMADVSSIFGATVGTIGTAWAQVVDGMQGIWANFVDTVEQLWLGALDRIIGSIQALPDVVRGSLSGVEDRLQNQRDELAKRDRPQSSFKDNVQKIASGALLPLKGVAYDQMTKNAPAPVKPATPEQYEKAKAGVTGFISGAKDFLTTGKLPDIGQAKPNEAPAPPATGGAPVQAPPEFKDRAEALSREVELGKITLTQAAQRYQALLKEAQAAKASADDIYKIEKGLSQVREESAKQAEKARKATEDARMERIKLVKGETAGLLEALEIEKRERAKAGADSVELEAWYGAQRIAIFQKDAEKKAEVAKKQTDLESAPAQYKIDELNAQDKTDAAALAALDQKQAEELRALKEQRDEIIKDHGDRRAAEKAYQDAVLQAEQSFQAQRTKLVADATKDRAKVELGVKNQTLRNEAAAESNPEKAQAKLREADNAERLQQIREQVEAYRKAGVEQTVIDKYVASEAKKIREEAKAAEKADSGKGEGDGKQTSPVQSLSEAFGKGLGFSEFSLNSDKRKRKRGDPATTAAANKLASDVGALAGAGTPAKDEGIQTTFTLTIKDEKGSEILSDTVTGNGTTKDMSTTYQLGRTA